MVHGVHKFTNQGTECGDWPVHVLCRQHATWIVACG